MEYFIISFIAGILTVLAPCVFPMLPVILGGSIGAKSLFRPFVVIFSLAISIVVFTLLLKFFVIGVPESILKLFSAGIIFFFGLTLIFPHLWEQISVKLNLGGSSQKFLSKSSQKEGTLGYVLLGVSLGPVFSACSPTYFLIVGTVLPQNFFIGFINLLIYATGLFSVLFLVAIFGQKITKRFSGLVSSGGWFRKFFGLVFILLAIGIYFGYDKQFESFLLDQPFFYDLATLESRIE